MDNETSQKRFESVYSTKVRAGKRRTYFFDVRRTKGDDFYITLTESTKRFNGDGYERHKIFLYKEDFNRFLSSLEEAINHVKTELMPDYDYDEFTKRQLEWEARRAEELQNKAAEEDNAKPAEDGVSEPVVEEPIQSEEPVTESPITDNAVTEEEVTEEEVTEEEVTEEAMEEESVEVVESTNSKEESTDTADLDEEEDMSW